MYSLGGERERREDGSMIQWNPFEQAKLDTLINRASLLSCIYVHFDSEFVCCHLDSFCTDMGIFSLLAGSEVSFVLTCDCYASDGGSGKGYYVYRYIYIYVCMYVL